MSKLDHRKLLTQMLLKRAKDFHHFVYPNGFQIRLYLEQEEIVFNFKTNGELYKVRQLEKCPHFKEK